MSELDGKIKAVIFSDGSCRGNPGHAGFGLFGYTYKHSVRPKNTKHPQKQTLSFTPDGIGKVKSEQPIETISIIEISKAICGRLGTNNEGELKAFYTALEKVLELGDISEVTIISDSSYVINGVKDNLRFWASNAWVKKDGGQLANLEDWKNCYVLLERVESLGTIVTPKWVKGHADDYGNETADMLAKIGSNTASLYSDAGLGEVVKTVLDQVIPYAEYSKSYKTNHHIYSYRDAYFTSANVTDDNYCFVSVPSNPDDIGKRDPESLFGLLRGEIPQVINSLKAVGRELYGEAVITCGIKLSRFDNRDLLRLAEIIPIKYMLVPRSNGAGMYYSLVDGEIPFLYHMGMRFPFIMNAARIFGKILDASMIMTGDGVPAEADRLTVNITDKIVSEGKLLLSNKDKNIDLTDKVSDKLTLKQRLILAIGLDIPSYLALKKHEAAIKEVHLILTISHNSNFMTAYTVIVLDDYVIYNTNMDDKFLVISNNLVVPTVT